eukprot:gene9971-biopygen19767
MGFERAGTLWAQASRHNQPAAKKEPLQDAPGLWATYWGPAWRSGVSGRRTRPGRVCFCQIRSCGTRPLPFLPLSLGEHVSHGCKPRPTLLRASVGW